MNSDTKDIINKRLSRINFKVYLLLKLKLYISLIESLYILDFRLKEKKKNTLYMRNKIILRKYLLTVEEN